MREISRAPGSSGQGAPAEHVGHTEPPDRGQRTNDNQLCHSDVQSDPPPSWGVSFIVLTCAFASERRTGALASGTNRAGRRNGPTRRGHSRLGVDVPFSHCCQCVYGAAHPLRNSVRTACVRILQGGAAHSSGRTRGTPWRSLTIWSSSSSCTALVHSPTTSTGAQSPASRRRRFPRSRSSSVTAGVQPAFGVRGWGALRRPGARRRWLIASACCCHSDAIAPRSAAVERESAARASRPQNPSSRR